MSELSVPIEYDNWATEKLAGFCAALSARGYDGWVVVEQDRVLENGDAFAGAAAEQVRNREWLREHAGW